MKTLRTTSILLVEKILQAGSLQLMSLSKGIKITNQIKSGGRDERSKAPFVRISLPKIIADLRHFSSLHFVNPYKFFTHLSKPVLLNLLTLNSQYEKLTTPSLRATPPEEGNFACKLKICRTTSILLVEKTCKLEARNR